MRGACWLAAAVVGLAAGAGRADDGPRLVVVESAPTVHAEKRQFLPSRDPERPCLVLEPVATLVLHTPPAEVGFWEATVRRAKFMAHVQRLRLRVRSWHGPLEMNLLLPPAAL